MDFDWPSYFVCAACDAEFLAEAVHYDDLGYPQCPKCAARTGPLASFDAADRAKPEIAD